MTIKITGIETHDVRFPTSRTLDGSDAVNVDPDYSAAYVILHTESAQRWAGKHAEFSTALKAHARQRLPGFATPEWVVIVEELPVCPFRYAHPHGIFKRQSLENVNRKDHENGSAQTGCFCEVIDIAAYGLV